MIYIDDVNDKLIVIRNVSLNGIEEPYRFIEALNKLGNCLPSTIDFMIKDFESADKYKYLLCNVKGFPTDFFKGVSSFTFVNLFENNEYYNWMVYFGNPIYTIMSLYKCEGNESITSQLKEYANYVKRKLIQTTKEDILNARKQQF